MESRPKQYSYRVFLTLVVPARISCSASILPLTWKLGCSRDCDDILVERPSPGWAPDRKCCPIAGVLHRWQRILDFLLHHLQYHPVPRRKISVSFVSCFLSRGLLYPQIPLREMSWKKSRGVDVNKRTVTYFIQSAIYVSLFHYAKLKIIGLTLTLVQMCSCFKLPRYRSLLIQPSRKKGNTNWWESFSISHTLADSEEDGYPSLITFQQLVLC